MVPGTAVVGEGFVEEKDKKLKESDGGDLGYGIQGE